jgi:hypothetical protein
MRILKSYRFGQLDAFLTHSKGEPVVLFQRAVGADGRQWGVALSRLHDYFRIPSALPTKYAMEQFALACDHMGFGATDRFAVHALADALYQVVDDVVKAPPESLFPEEKGAPIGEIVLRDGNGFEHGIEMHAKRVPS